MDPRNWSTETKIVAGVGAAAVIGAGAYLLLTKGCEETAPKETKARPLSLDFII